MREDVKARVIALYLPQFHPTPENDLWWGKGFTEWTNVGKAKPLFRGHYQPKVPADLGYYDLRIPEIRKEQAKMAQDAGVEGFCYWHYWFGKGKMLLERPFAEVLNSREPNFPFCLGWANESWSNKSWNNKSSKVSAGILMEQLYSKEDYFAHFYHVLPAFKDDRYIKVDGKPLFVVFKPLSIPDPQTFIATWQSLAVENGLNGIYFVGIVQNIAYKTETGKFVVPTLDGASEIYCKILALGFDAVNSRGYMRAEMAVSGKMTKLIKKIVKRCGFSLVERYRQKEINDKLFVEEDAWENVFPTVLPNWDRSPRSGKRAVVYTDSTPKVFADCLKDCLSLIKNKTEEHKIIFLQSWNEWGEGNYVEPDLRYGHGYLDALRETILK